MNKERVEQAIKDLLVGLGEDVSREGLKDTPKRVARFYDSWLNGGGYKPSVFSANYKNLIIVKDIPLYSLCEHHILPFVGKAAIGYIPTKDILGLSKIVRILNKHSRRLQIQERLTEQIADEIEAITKAQGVMVVIEAEHLCMSMRGVQAPGTKTITSSIRGDFADDQAARMEFLQLIRR